MAIGKQGAYATVEGGVVDFGKITTEAIDKYQTQQALQEKLKQEKAAAKAKAISDEIKNLKSLDKYSSSNNENYDNVALAITNDLANGLHEEQNKVATGESNSLKANQYAENANQVLATMNSTAKHIQDKASAYAKLADEKKLNPDSINIEAQKNILKDIKYIKNSNGTITYYHTDENGTQIADNPIEIVDKVYNPVFKVDLPVELKKIKDVLDQDKIAKPSGGFVVTQTEQSKRFLGGVSASAVNLLGDRSTKAELWSDYQRSLPGNKAVVFKVDGFSEKENQDLYNYTYNKVLGMYPEEKSMTQLSKSGGGNNGDKTTFTPTTYDPSQSFGNYGKTANGLGISVSDASTKSKQVILSSIPIGKATDKLGTISNALVTDVMYDDKGRMVANMTYVDWKSTKLTKEQKEKGLTLMQTKGFDDLDAIADELGVSSATLAESRKTHVQPIGKAAQSKVLSKMGLTDAQLKAKVGYSGTVKPTSTKTTTKKEISRGDIASKAQAAGYSVKEYEALLIKNGVTIK
jgi:hypothetical protein